MLCTTATPYLLSNLLSIAGFLTGACVCKRRNLCGTLFNLPSYNSILSLWEVRSRDEYLLGCAGEGETTDISGNVVDVGGGGNEAGVSVHQTLVIHLDHMKISAPGSKDMHMHCCLRMHIKHSATTSGDPFPASQ